MNNGNGDDGSRMNGDIHVRFCESAGVKLPRATHPIKQGMENFRASDNVEILYSRRLCRRWGLLRQIKGIPFAV